MWVIYEDGIWELIFRSNKPEAKAIKKRVKAILREIRETGRFNAQPPAIPDMSTPEGRLMILDIATRAEQRALALTAKVAELEPDAARARQTLDATGLSLVRAVAKRFGIKEKALREFLYAEHLLIRGGSSHNEPYARHVQSGHFELKTTLVEIDPDRPAQAKSTTYVTPKGEALIWRRLHEAGYVRSREMPPAQLELLSI
jgi:phage antirepressor YoqD-like protein